MTKRTFKSSFMAAIHETAEDLHAVGAISKKTMRGFDDRCLTPLIDVEPEEIRALRDEEMISQTVLARHLNVTPGLVSQWERGEKKPSGPSLKLLSLIKHKGLEAII
jgi:putative transcriptional regulator